MAPKQAAGFTPPDAREILAHVRGARLTSPPIERKGKKPPPPKARIWLGKVGPNGMTAASGDTPGKGDVILYHLDRPEEGDATIASRKQPDGQTEVTKTAYNFGAPIAPDLFCMVMEDVTGGLWAVPNFPTRYKRYRTVAESMFPGGTFWEFPNTEPADAVYTNPYFQRDGSNQVICQEDGWYRVSVSVMIYPRFTTAVRINVVASVINDIVSQTSLDNDFIMIPAGTPADVAFGANFVTLENFSAGDRVGVLISGSYSPTSGETFAQSVKMHVGEKMHSLT